MAFPTNGPSVRFELSCFDCKHCTSEKYVVQGDSGHDVYCNHVDVTKKRVGDTIWRTPDWCPEMEAAIRRFVDRHFGKKKEDE